MKKWLFPYFILALLFSRAFAGNSPYKIDDREIDLLFEQSQEIFCSAPEVQNILLSFPQKPVFSTDEDKRIIAGVLGILLGGLGIHRFYLGHSRAALIGYCLPSLCLGLGYIPGLVDGILYLIATDEEFNNKYRNNEAIWAWL